MSWQDIKNLFKRKEDVVLDLAVDSIWELDNQDPNPFTRAETVIRVKVVACKEGYVQYKVLRTGLFHSKKVSKFLEVYKHIEG